MVIMEFKIADPSQLHVLYQSAEKNNNIRIAEGDPFTPRCRVGYSSNLPSGRWAPTLRWYNHHNDIISSSTFYDGSNIVRQDTTVTATEEMHGQSFRCHTSYGAAQGNVGTNTTNHVYSTSPPTYRDDQTIMINVDRKSLSFIVTWPNESKLYNN